MLLPRSFGVRRGQYDGHELSGRRSAAFKPAVYKPAKRGTLGVASGNTGLVRDRESAAIVLPQGSEASDELLKAMSMPMGGIQAWWATIPARSKLVAACSTAFMLSNMDKVNMTVAIVPLGQELGWSATTSGLVQSAFFWGFLLAQIPGSYASSCKGGRNMLPPSVALWSSATALLPLTVGSMPALCLTRSVMGMGEAVAPSAVVDMLARTIPKEERAGAVSSAFSGLHFGSVIGLLVSPAIIHTFGWRCLFASFGLVGLIWCSAFQLLMQDIERQEPQLAALLEPQRAPAEQAWLTRLQSLVRTGAARQQQRTGGTLVVPYRAMLRSRPVQVLMFTHFAHNWLSYTMLAWLPTYFTDTLSIDLTHASHTALLPPLASIVGAAIAGRSADWLIAAGMPVESVRKAAQCTAFLVPAGLLTAVCIAGGEVAQAALPVAAAGGADAATAAAVGTAAIGAATAVAMSSAVTTAATAAGTAAVGSAALGAASAVGLTPHEVMTVAGITLALGASSFSLAGLYCTHQDLSPKYASAMLGLTNTAASLPGIFGVSLVGFLLDQTDKSWELSLFAPTVALLLSGSVAYTWLGSNAAVDFDELDDSPFAVEGRLLALRRAWDGLISSLRWGES